MSNDFRRGVGIFLLNSEKKLWVGKRLDYISDFWQMPQGGIDGEETPLEAMIRELGEEVGHCYGRTGKDSIGGKNSTIIESSISSCRMTNSVTVKK